MMNAWQLDRPVFVVGVPRSGTTLLSTVLSSSKELCVAPEIWFYNYWKPKYQFLDFSKPREYEFFIDQFLNSARFGFLELSSDTLRRDILAADAEPSFEVVFSMTLLHYASQLDRARVGEKTPGQFQNIRELLTRFPDSRVICMLRDPLAVVASTLDSSFGSKHVSKAAKRWANYTRLIEQFRDHERVQFLRYEDLVTNFGEVAPMLRQFLEITLDDDANKSKRDGVYRAGARNDEWANTHFNKSMQPINADSLDKWKDRLTTRQKSIVWSIVQDEAERLLYKRSETSDFVPIGSGQSVSEFLAAKLESLLQIQSRFLRSPRVNRLRYRLSGRVPEPN